MSPLRLSIRTRFLLVSFFTILFWLLLSLFYLDGVNRFADREKKFLEVSSMNNEYFQLQSALNQLIIAYARNDSSTGVNLLVNDCLGMIRLLEGRCTVFGDPEIYGYGPEPLKSLGDFSKILGELTTLLSMDNTSFREFATRLVKYRTILDSIYAEIITGILSEDTRVLRRNAGMIKISTATGVLLIALVMFFTGTYLRNRLLKLNDFASRLALGKIPEKIEITSTDEISEISEQLNHLSSDLQKKLVYLQAIGKDDDIMSYSPGKDDSLGNAMVVLANHLRTRDLDERKRKLEDDLRNWSTTGFARMGEILRSEMDNLQELSFRIIQTLVSYLKVEMGAIFIMNDDDPDQPFLEVMAAYAFDRRKYLQKIFKPGEGLPGTCAIEKERIYVTDVPGDYYEITSGTGNALPGSILLEPLKIDGTILGVIELASVRTFGTHELDFAGSVAESIAATIAVVKSNEKTAGLLKESRRQAEVLNSQEEKMRSHMEELRRAQEESKKKETEISGILNAMNQASLVAEYDTNGRISGANERFIMLMESSRDQVIGKHHSEFATVDRYSDDYRNFWNTLREGKSISKEEIFKLYSGKEVWLQQTFTPIMNSDGKVYKILNIAVDITENRDQQQNLEVQAGEIKRRSREMETLNLAVDASIIKCELNSEGIITDLNQKFSETSGYSRKEMLGRSYRLFLKDTEKEQFEKIWTEVRKEKTYEGVMRRTKPTGEEVWLMSTFSPVKDEEGNIYKIYFLALDITEKKLKYQLLEEANNEVERLRKRLKDYEEG